MSEGNLKRIHVNGHQIRENKEENLYEPVIVAKANENGESLNEYGHVVDIIGKGGDVVAQVGMNPEFGRGPLSCGAVAWVQTRRPIRVRDSQENTQRVIGDLKPKDLYD